MKYRERIIIGAVIVLGASLAIAATSGITTQQAYTAAPIAIDLSNSTPPDAGVSMAFVASDAVFKLRGVLGVANGGTGSSTGSGFVQIAPSSPQTGAAINIVGEPSGGLFTPAISILGGTGGSDGIDAIGGDTDDGSQTGFGGYFQAGGTYPNADGGLGGVGFESVGSGATYGLVSIGGPRGGYGAQFEGGCGRDIVGASGTACDGPSFGHPYAGAVWGEGIRSYGAGFSSGVFAQGGFDGGTGVVANGGQGNSRGIFATGSGTLMGGQFQGGVSAGPGIVANAGFGGVGAYLNGNGAGAGLVATGGSSGPAIIANGVTSFDGGVNMAGGGNFDLSGGSGAFKPPNGVATFGGSSNSFSNGVTFNGSLLIKNSITTTGAGGSTFDFSGSSGQFTTTSGSFQVPASSTTIQNAVTINSGGITSTGANSFIAVTSGTPGVGDGIDVTTGFGAYGIGVKITTSSASQAPLYLSPNTAPTSSDSTVKGAMYFDSAKNRPGYHNGTSYQIATRGIQVSSSGGFTATGTVESGSVGCVAQGATAVTSAVIQTCIVSGGTLTVTTAAATTQAFNVIYW